VSADPVAALLSQAGERLHAAGVESPRREARLLLAYVLGVRQEDILTDRLPALTPEIRGRFETVLLRRIAREPYAYIVGSREFWSLDFAVGPGVLIPRPESETLIEEALRRFPAKDAPLRVADLGTGSGCLLLAFLSERPNAQGIGIDTSQDALAFATRSAETLGLADRAEFIPGNWTENLSGTFDAIFVNPPYIVTGELDGLEREVVCFEPKSALDGGSDGLQAYRLIAAGLKGHLSLQGLVFLEIGRGQGEAVEAILAQEGVVIEGTVCDLAGIPRCVVAGVATSSNTSKKQLALETRSG
jgi:release factor glutamine methyltransferase